MLIVIAAIGAGERFLVEGVSVETPVPLPLGFKVAALDLAAGHRGDPVRHADRTDHAGRSPAAS